MKRKTKETVAMFMTVIVAMATILLLLHVFGVL